MSITVEINKKQLDKNLKMHYLPFKIDADDSETNVDEYFNNYTKEENSHLVNSFRGYPLQGIELRVPPNYKGIVFQETNKLFTEKSERLLRVTGTFANFNYWNYDKVPSKADNLRQALQVIDIADELSQSVSLEEIEKEIEMRQEIKREY